MLMTREYQHGNTTVHLLNYPFVWCPKRRRKVLRGRIESRLREVICEVAKEHEWEVLALEVMPDHVHLFLGAVPDASPMQIMHAVKGRSARVLRTENPELRRMPSLWTRSYFVSTARNVSAATVERYIAEQKTRD